MPPDFSSLSKPEDRPKTIVFDKDGDLTLLVGPLKTPFKVDSKSLARASPVFKAMFYRPFAESKAKFAEGDWVIHLPEDQVIAMEIILNIVHVNVPKIPRTLPNTVDIYKRKRPFSSVCLYLVSRAADKYRVVNILNPWLDTWLKAARRLASDWSAEMLRIAWILGDERLLGKQLDMLVRTTFIEADPIDIGNEALTSADTRCTRVDLAPMGVDHDGILGILNIKGTLLSNSACL